MDPLHVLGAVAAMMSTAVVATWVLAKAINRVEVAISVHVAEDAATHKQHEARIISLENRRGPHR